jgi:hypothetical protein
MERAGGGNVIAERVVDFSARNKTLLALQIGSGKGAADEGGAVPIG